MLFGNLFMGKGLIMIAAGVALLILNVAVTLINAITEPKRRKRLEEYLKEKY